MAKIIVTSRVTRNSPKGNAGNLVKYMARCEGVEKLLVNKANAYVTVRQQRFINQILQTDSDTKNYFEYQDYTFAPWRFRTAWT